MTNEELQQHKLEMREDMLRDQQIERDLKSDLNYCAETMGVDTVVSSFNTWFNNMNKHHPFITSKEALQLVGEYV